MPLDGAYGGKKSVGRDTTDVRRQVEQRMAGLRRDRYSWFVHWWDIALYELPRRGNFLVNPGQQAYRGSPVNNRILDVTPILAIRTLTSGMMAGITSPARPWFGLTLENQDVADLDPVKTWLDEVRKRMLRIMSRSNFYNAMAVLYEELAVFGTATMLIYEDFEDVIRCYNPTAGEYFLANSDRLHVDTFYREFTMSARQMAQKFGQDKLSQSAQNMLSRPASSQPDAEFMIGHAIEPNGDFIPGEYGLKGAPFRQVYWEQGGNANEVLEEKLFMENPAICPRWHVVGNDAYGRGPGMDSLGDCKQLAVETRRKAEAIEKQVRPPLIADIQLKNFPAMRQPDGITYVAGIDNVGMKPVYTVDPKLTEMNADLLNIQNRIKETFFYDLFLMISQLETVRTATEILARKEEKLLMLGPVLERFENEALTPAINRIYNIAVRRGLIPPPPKEIAGQELQPQFTSMLSEAQKSITTTSIERVVGFIGNLSAAKPEALDRLNVDNTIDEYSSGVGATPKILIPVAQANKVRVMRAQAEAQAAAQAQAAAVASAAVEGAKTLSETETGAGQNALAAILGNPI